MEEIEGEEGRAVDGAFIKDCSIIEPDHARWVIIVVRRYG
jgi:hypothetical protein